MTSSSSSSKDDNKKKIAAPDAPLNAIGFEVEELTPQRIVGHLRVTEICCQPFKVLHGGISALIAESLASMGAHMASGFKRIAGIQLTINHLKSADLGDLVRVVASPINIGKTIQVWQVRFWKLLLLPATDYDHDHLHHHYYNQDAPAAADNGNRMGMVMISSSTVTLLCNLPVPPHAKQAGDALRKSAKL